MLLNDVGLERFEIINKIFIHFPLIFPIFEIAEDLGFQTALLKIWIEMLETLDL